MTPTNLDKINSEWEDTIAERRSRVSAQMEGRFRGDPASQGAAAAAADDVARGGKSRIDPATAGAAAAAKDDADRAAAKRK